MTDIRYSSSFKGQFVQRPAVERDKPRLLVIDDDRSVCTLIERLGEKAGFAAMCAPSLEEATRSLRAHQFDCITLDLGIGKDTGVEVLKILGEKASTASIIIISGSMRSMRDFAVGIGKRMHLELEQLGKPIDFGLLRTKLTNIKMKFDAAHKQLDVANS